MSPATPPEVQIEDRIREAAWSVARSSFTSLRGHLQRVHLSPPQYWVLQMLEGTDPLSTGEISDRLGVRLPTVTGLLDLLAKQGLVARHASSSDRRKVLLRLTPRGVSRLHAVRGRLQSGWHEQLKELSRGRKLEILGALRDLEARIEREPSRRELCSPGTGPAGALRLTRRKGAAE
ncbi:MAG TPA: MarR family transcriptional regulator [Thermoplasmata archaeon]|nr:MarR family transcriptional regulator [Thermoplasmata archaeon]